MFANSALASDYIENGYRRLIPVAIEEPALMHALLAMSASHMAKLQKIEDTLSVRYYRTALLLLQRMLKQPHKMIEESVVATMLCLLGYEVNLPGCFSYRTSKR